MSGVFVVVLKAGIRTRPELLAAVTKTLGARVWFELASQDLGYVGADQGSTGTQASGDK